MIYFDNAATTATYKECSNIIATFNEDSFFNPSARYSKANEVSREIKIARGELAALLNVEADEICYVSSGSEGDNLALNGALRKKGERIVISQGEHPAVYNTALFLKNKGYDVQFADINRNGSVNVDSLISLVDSNTKLVSIMHVNNETGAINDIAELAMRIKQINPNTLFHSDGVQAFGKIPVNLAALGVDLYTISGHKIHAPKGIAALYIKKGLVMNPLIYGGGQENNIRSSTENISGIMAFSYAAKRICSTMKQSINNAEIIKKNIIKSLTDKFCEDVVVNSTEDCSPFIINLSIKGIKGEVLLHSLEAYDILISTGSACSTKKGVSRIPFAMKLPKTLAEGTIRLSFSEFSTIEEAEQFIDKANECINKLIKMSRV